MKRLIVILMALSLSIPGVYAATEKVPASDPRIVYLGRTLADASGSVSFDWSGTSARLGFSGKSLSVRLASRKTSWFNVWIDRPTSEEPDKVFGLSDEERIVSIIDADYLARRFGKQARRHAGDVFKVTIQRRNEGRDGSVVIKEFICDGTISAGEGIRKRVIEFIGDSYTCGYGADTIGRESKYSPATENCNHSYCSIVARYFDADPVMIAHSGIGVARNSRDRDPGYTMVERYGQTFDMLREPLWDASKASFKPDITVIYLCTNDFEQKSQPHFSIFKKRYQELLGKVKANYGEDHPVLCVASRSDYYCTDYVRNSVDGCNLKNVAFAAFFESVINNGPDLGAQWHPNYAGHRKKAHVLIPYISTLTGWEMDPDKPIR
mgnify:CR=1 FL=1